MGWSLLDHTGDLRLEVEHSTLAGLFAEALRGFTDCLTDVGAVRPALDRRIELAAGAPDLLLVDWLEEALFLFDTEALVFARAEVELSPPDGSQERTSLASRLAGERFDPARHPLKAPIKGVTYHALELGRAGGGWRARVVFDL